MIAGTVVVLPQNESRALVPFLKRDALSPLGWFNLGVAASKFGNHELAEISFLIAATVVPNDVESWGNAFISGFSAKSPSLRLAMITQAAYRRLGEQFITYIRENVRKQLSSVALEKFEHLLFDLAHGAYEQRAKSTTPMVIRILDADGLRHREIPLGESR